MKKILAINSISFKKRMIELLFDYLFILAYLALLFLGSMLFYTIFFDGIPEFTEIQSQCLVFFTSVLPIILLFTFLDYTKNGRRKQDFHWFTRKKQCKLACLETPLNFFLGK